MGQASPPPPARKCFSPSLAKPSSSSPWLWLSRSPLPSTRNVALRRSSAASPTPCSTTSSMDPSPTSASTTASTLGPALPAQSFASKEVISQLSAWLKYQSRWLGDRQLGYLHGEPTERSYFG